MSLYRWVRPFLFVLDAEQAHRAAFSLAGKVQSISPSLVRPWFAFGDRRLPQELWGLSFENPVGLAAGMDKNAELVPFWEALGFGFVSRSL